MVRDHPDLAALPDRLPGRQRRAVHLMLEKGLQADQLQRLWGGGNKPYKLSFGCLVNTVLIDSERVRSVARVKQIRIQTEDSSK